MKRGSVVSIGMFLVLFLTGAVAHANFFAPWSNLTQQQRNQAIIDRAYQNNNMYVGQNCKEWVRTVVYAASGNHVTVPATTSGGYG